MNNRDKTIKSLALAIILINFATSFCAGATLEHVQSVMTDTYTVAFPDMRLVIKRNQQEVANVDLKGLKTQNEHLLVGRSALCKISPDGKCLPVIIYASPRALDVLLICLEDGSVKRRELMRGGEEYLLERLEWISPTKFRVDYKANFGKSIFFDIAANTSSFHVGECDLAYSRDGANCASVYNKSMYRWPGDPYFAWKSKTLDFGVSEAIRYNGYWVYPQPMKGFVTSEESLAVSSLAIDINDRYPEIFPFGIQSERTHVFSHPAFIGDTDVIGIFEWVFNNDDRSGAEEQNIVLLDASDVKTNPPLESDIWVLKRPIDLRWSLDDAGDGTIDLRYYDIRFNMHAVWNGTAGELELWKSTGWGSEEGERQKLMSVGIAAEQIAFGEIRRFANQEDAEWSDFTKRRKPQ